MESPEDLNETDHAILDLLGGGRETTGSLADELGKSPNYIRGRLKLMRMNDWVRYYHEPTGLHELLDDPRTEDSRA